MTLPSGTRLGPYGILGPIGAGGMGEVYRARDERLGRDVAVKVLPADVAVSTDRLKRFEKEARAASALNHLATGQRSFFKRITPADPTGVGSVATVQLTPDGRSYCYSYMRSLSRLYVVDGLR